MDNPGRSKLVNSLIESIRSASNKKTNLADPIIAAIRRTVPNRRNTGTGTNNNNRRNASTVTNNNNRRNASTVTNNNNRSNYGNNNNRRNMGTGTNNRSNYGNMGTGTNNRSNYGNNNNRRNMGTGTNNRSNYGNMGTGTNNWVPRRRNVSTGTNDNWVPRRRNVSNNYNLFSRRRTPNYNSSVNRMRTPNFETNSSVNRMRTPNFENGRENNNGSMNIRRSPKFENNQIRGRLQRHLPTFDTAPGTKTIYPGMGLKVLKNVLDTTPKRYLRKVIKREASTRKAKKLLPKKKKFLVEYVQSEIRPKKRKSSVQVLI